MHRCSRQTGFALPMQLCLVAWMVSFSLPLRAQLDTSAWPQVRMEILALNAQGEPQTGLTKDALEVKEGKEVHPVADLQPADGPQSVCVLIDASGSMYDRLDLVKTKAKRLVKSLPATDEFCLADFSQSLYLDQKFTQDKAAIDKGLTMARASGGTAVRDALLALADYMRHDAKYRSRTIILFSDGADNSSKAGWDQLRQGFEKAGSPVVHILCLPPAMGNARAKQVDPEEKSALRMVKPSGGLAYFPHNMTDINSVVDNLGQVLASRYVLTFVADNTTRDGQEQGIQISFDKAHRKDRAELLAPEGYYAPSP